MKKVVISSVFTALLVLSGCGDKDPKVDANQNAAAQEVTSSNNGGQVAPTSTQSTSSSRSDSGADSSDTMSSIEKEFATIYFD